jgi:CheY-like chemotaxis protein
MGTDSLNAGNAIMVVDDTELFALCVKTFLQFDGYERIKIFSCPLKALDDVQRHGCPVFIITDYEMPVMDGAVLLKSVRQLYPRAHGVIMTCSSTVPPDISSRFTIIRKDDDHFFDHLRFCLQKEFTSGETFA